MKPSDLETHFGSQIEAARALGLDRRTVWAWFSRGSIPIGRQYQIEVATKGKLKAQRSGAAA